MPRNVEVFTDCYKAYQRCREISYSPRIASFGGRSGGRTQRSDSPSRSEAFQYIVEFEKIVTGAVEQSAAAVRFCHERLFQDDPMLTAFVTLRGDKRIQIARIAGGALRANSLWPARTALKDLGERF